jgi:hypothetical protein
MNKLYKKPNFSALHTFPKTLQFQPQFNEQIQAHFTQKKHLFSKYKKQDFQKSWAD